MSIPRHTEDVAVMVGRVHEFHGASMPKGVNLVEAAKSTKLIELQDGIFIEVEVPTDQAKQIASSFADRVDKTVGIIKPVLVKLCHPVSEALQEIKSQMPVEEAEAEVEINLGFTTEGNIYVTKVQSSSSLKIKLTFKPKS